MVLRITINIDKSIGMTKYFCICAFQKFIYKRLSKKQINILKKIDVPYTDPCGNPQLKRIIQFSKNVNPSVLFFDVNHLFGSNNNLKSIK